MNRYSRRNLLKLGAAGLTASALPGATSGSEPAGPAQSASGRIEPATPTFVTPNQFEGTDIERINRAIEAAALDGGRVVIPRVNRGKGSRPEVWLIDAAILLKEGVTLELDNCRIKLSDRCRDNMIRSANCGLGIEEIRPLRNIHIRGIGNAVLEGADHPRASGDAAKPLGAKTYGTDAGREGENQNGDWRNVGILLAYVENFSIQNVEIRDSHCWAISLERCAHGTLRDLRFASAGFKMIDGARCPILNQDGIDLRLGCYDILIENITGYTGDDLIALTAIARTAKAPGAPAAPTTMVSDSVDRGGGQDDIRQVIIRNVKGYCRGGANIVRLLNTSGARMYDVVLDGLIDTSPPEIHCATAVRIGDSNLRYGGVTPLGDTRRIVVQNVFSHAKQTVLIAGSLCDSFLNNIIQYDSGSEAVTLRSGPQFVRNVTMTNIRVVEPPTEPKEEPAAGKP